jgi:hypothetical protein
MSAEPTTVDFALAAQARDVVADVSVCACYFAGGEMAGAADDDLGYLVTRSIHNGEGGSH